MSSDSVCRSCVTKDVKMFSLDEELQEIYEKLTSTKVSGDNGSPLVCFICYSHLQRCKRFSKVAQRSQQLLRDSLRSGISQELQPCKLLNLQIVENLSVTVAHSGQHSTNNNTPEDDGYNYICVIEQPIKVKIEEVQENCIKQEIINIKMERIDLEIDKEYDTDQQETTNTEESNCVPNETTMNEGLFPKTVSKPFSCSKCSKAFFKSKNLIEHMKDCLVSADLTCKICDLTFSNIGKLKTHSLIHSKKPFDYDLDFLLPKRHKIKHSYELLVCKRCNQSFKTAADLSTHSKIHSSEKRYACELCGKSFTTVQNYKIHMTIHAGTREFICAVCSKAFYTKGNLKAHMRCHTGERPFQCNECGLTFGFKSSLKEHIRRLHTEVKPFPCDKCYLSFNKEVALTTHLRSHYSSRSYKCQICYKSFTSPRGIKDHMDVHSDKRPFKCTKCGKGFKRPEHLKQHCKSVKCKENTDSMSS